MNARTAMSRDPEGAGLIDSFGRKVTYLRLSITDRCNLRCRYCMPAEGVQVLGHDSILSYEELERVSRLFVQLGVEKIRITGGEPFVRKGCLEFLQRLKQQNPTLNLHLTTNGVAVLPHLPDLKKLGLKGLNLSLDTLDQERFKDVTRRDKLDTVLAVFHKSLELGIPLKVNTVVQADTSDEELERMAELTRDNEVGLRFIELMPFSGRSCDTTSMSRSLEQRLFELFPDLTEVPAKTIETARKFSMPGYKGTLGIIEGETRKFCKTCNKVRVTSSGILKNCLYDKGVLNLRELLRTEADDREVTARIIESISRKLSNGHDAEKLSGTHGEDSMATIGG